MQKTFDVVIPTRGNYSVLEPLLKALVLQTCLPQQVVLIVDARLSDTEILELNNLIQKVIQKKILLNCVYHGQEYQSWKVFIAGKGVSYVRNVGISLTSSEFTCLLDDDVTFAPDFFQSMLSEYLHLSTSLWSFDFAQDKSLNSDQHAGSQGLWFILIPTIYRRNSHHIQTKGIHEFIYRTGYHRPLLEANKKSRFAKLFLCPIPKSEYAMPQMVQSISMFGPRIAFQSKYDERFRFVFEDLEFSYRIWKKYPLIVTPRVTVHHFERTKTRAEMSFVATPFLAFEKAKNTILFVRKHATLRQKIQFFGCWLFFFVGWFTVFILVTTHSLKTLRAFWHGIRMGLCLT